MFRFIVLNIFFFCSLSLRATAVDAVDALAKEVEKRIFLKRPQNLNSQEEKEKDWLKLRNHQVGPVLTRIFKGRIEFIVKVYESEMRALGKAKELLSSGPGLRLYPFFLRKKTLGFTRLLEAIMGSFQHREELCRHLARVIHAENLDEDTLAIRQKLVKTLWHEERQEERNRIDSRMISLFQRFPSLDLRESELTPNCFLKDFMTRVEEEVDAGLETEIDYYRSYFDRETQAFFDRWVHTERSRYFKYFKEEIAALLKERPYVSPFQVQSPSHRFKKQYAHDPSFESAYYFFGPEEYDRIRDINQPKLEK